MSVCTVSSTERLDASRIRSALPGWVRLGGLSVHGAIDSTNSWLLERSPALPAPYACVCEHQLAGRGRHGRIWEDGTGRDICLSLLWRFDAAQARAQALSLAIGVAAVRALAPTGASGIGLKWPNDIVWRDRKLGGILIEGSVSGRLRAVVIGVGINVHPGPGPVPDARALRVYLGSISGAQASRNHLAAGLIAEISAECMRFEAWGAGPAIDEWQRFDAMHGRPVRVHRPSGDIGGIARGVDETGELLVEVDGVLERFVSAEVSLRPDRRMEPGNAA